MYSLEHDFSDTSVFMKLSTHIINVTYKRDSIDVFLSASNLKKLERIGGHSFLLLTVFRSF